MEKQKYQLEFNMKKTPVSLLWSYISSASGLKEWFADAVEISGKNYTFYWEKQPHKATVISIRNEQSIRWRWDDEHSKAYVEMRIEIDDFNDTTMLTLTDFAETADMDDSKELWDTQIGRLQQMLGC